MLLQKFLKNTTNIKFKFTKKSDRDQNINKMTPEEIKETIEGMLQVQKELQQTQIKQSDQINKLIEQGREQDRRIQQLVGYSITQRGDILDV